MPAQSVSAQGRWPGSPRQRAVTAVASMLVIALVVGVFGLRPSSHSPSAPGAAVVPTASPSRTPAASVSIRPFVSETQQPAATATVRPLPTPAPSVAPTPSPVPSVTYPPGTKVVRIAVSVPLREDPQRLGSEALLAVQLAVKNAPKIPGYAIEVVPDDLTGLGENGTYLQDPSVVAVIGPLDSDTARSQLPDLVAAGLLACSPGASDTTLTRGASALQLRAANPKRAAFVRIAATTASESTALAQWVVKTYGPGARAAVVGDGTEDGTLEADAFQQALTRAGGTAIRTDAKPDTADYTALMARWGSVSVVFFGGTTSTGAAALRSQLKDQALGATPMLAPDGIYNGQPYADNLYIPTGGDGVRYTRTARAIQTSWTGQPAFAQWYRAQTSFALGDYSAAAYACTQVAIDAIARTAKAGGADRDAVRTLVTNPASTFKTIFGTTGFDAYGDNRTQAVTLYTIDWNDGTNVVWRADGQIMISR